MTCSWGLTPPYETRGSAPIARTITRPSCLCYIPCPDVGAPSFPDWVEPMAATLTQDRFTGPEWIFERKLDGIRLLAFKNGPDIRLLSRNRLPQHLPWIAEAVAGLPPHDLILDGEVTWDTRAVSYHVFDIMWLDGRDVTALPLEARRAL